VTAGEREALMAAAKLGLPALPCLESKRPACPHGLKDARTAEAGLATLWARYPGTLVGVPTGEFTGFDVLDVDNRNGGAAWWAANREALPPTRIHRTRGGGAHVFFAHRPGLRNSAGKIAPGVDIRADGGYIVWWPAHRLEVRSPDLALDKLPSWPDVLLSSLADQLIAKASRPIVRMAGRVSPYGAAAMNEAAIRIFNAPNGEQNDVLNRECYGVGQLVAAGHLPEREALDALLLSAHSMPDFDRRRPWRDREVECRVASSFAAGKQNPRF
jgi:hypothetical protein